MSCTDHDCRLFCFERYRRGVLQELPMAVRFKLDLCQLKVSLRHWLAFSLEERVALLEAPAQPVSYAQLVNRTMQLRFGHDAPALLAAPMPVWLPGSPMPVSLLDCLDELRETWSEGEHLMLVQKSWTALAPVQRFVLHMITRRGIADARLRAALQDFSLLRQDAYCGRMPASMTTALHLS